MIKEIKKKNRGFVLLFAVTLSAILLSIALGVTNIAFRESKFGTNARDTNDAFFAADTGIECAFINDKFTSTIFVSSPIGPMQCLGGNISVSGGSGPTWSFILGGLGLQAQGCAKVTVNKSGVPIVITSNGYNNGSGGSSPNWTCTQNINTVERQIESRY